MWEDIPLDRPFCAGGARLEAVPLAGSYPGFAGQARVSASAPEEAVLGLFISPPNEGGTLAFLPGVGSVSEALLDRLESCDAILFDGTFWSDGEPARIPGLGRTARQMGHLPVSGPGGSLERLATLRRPRKIYIHINNTNPILDEAGPEHRAVREAGWEIAWDGLEISL
jgi:pyrroloquinoline quinone biosynthesis protein B